MQSASGSRNAMLLSILDKPRFRVASPTSFLKARIRHVVATSGWLRYPLVPLITPGSPLICPEPGIVSSPPIGERLERLYSLGITQPLEYERRSHRGHRASNLVRPEPPLAACVDSSVSNLLRTSTLLKMGGRRGTGKSNTFSSNPRGTTSPEANGFAGGGGWQVKSKSLSSPASPASRTSASRARFATQATLPADALIRPCSNRRSIEPCRRKNSLQWLVRAKRASSAECMWVGKWFRNRAT